MVSVVPSQIVNYLDDRCPQAKQQMEGVGSTFYLEMPHAPIVQTILSMVESLPPHLLIFDGDSDDEFKEAISAIRFAVDAWKSGNKIYKLEKIPNRQKLHPFTLLRKNLVKLPDEGVAKKKLIFQTAFGLYGIVGIIGEGGSGRVYKVEDESSETYAVKCIHPENLTQKRRKRFKNELSFCHSNDHKNILKVLDWGSVELKGKQCPFFVMPYYPSTLRTLMKEGIEHNRILVYFSQILDGVEAAHLQGIWHRDLKPENILYNPSSDLLVVADFGIAHFAEELLHTSIETHDAERRRLQAEIEEEERRQRVLNSVKV